jgi:hypothetical protein
VRAYGWAGLGIVLGAEALLFAGDPHVGGWFTPIVWTGYLLFADALVARLTGRSYLTTSRVDGVLVALASILCWWLFEWYNAPRFWRGGADAVGLWWQYHDTEPNPWLRRIGYDWAFATIFPALFLTAAAFRALFAGARVSPWHPSPALLNTSIVLGLIAVTLPLFVVSRWLVPLVWTGWVMVLEPINYRRGRRSWLAALALGDVTLVCALLAAGLVCGVLWEFWNYWAVSRWTYTVPYLGSVKLFEMPVLGFLGFPPFALECYAMWAWLRGWLGPEDPGTPVL